MAVADLSRALPRMRLDRRTAMGLAAAALAAFLVLVLTRPTPMVPVLVAGADLPTGVPLGEMAIEVRRLPSAEGLVEGASVGELADWTLVTPLAAGEPLVPSLLRPPARGAAPDLMSIAVEESHAALGEVGAGDRVDVWVTWPAGAQDRARTELLAEGVNVVEARQAGAGLGGGAQVEILLAVDDRLAGRLAAALRGGELDLVKVGR
ncbi:MAG: RcpC/CpaB family pilus assembly protein [Actinomycetota bacterium]|nr:RcpC/CpaB family pilus assembly protein [Actinomycetota bacterium]